MYIPHQRDIVFINFDPSLGAEIKKRRTAVDGLDSVMSVQFPR